MFTLFQNLIFLSGQFFLTTFNLRRQISSYFIVSKWPVFTYIAYDEDG